jgi:hypothetical protein
MNIERLTILAEIFEGKRTLEWAGRPVEFDMTEWSSFMENCGAACCIGGHVDILWVNPYEKVSGMYIPLPKSRDALELTDKQAGDLFYMENSDLPMEDVTPAIAARYIRQMIAGEEPSWEKAFDRSFPK